MHQWNRIQSPEINPGIYGHVILDKSTNTEEVFSTICVEKVGYLYVKP